MLQTTDDRQTDLTSHSIYSTLMRGLRISAGTLIYHLPGNVSATAGFVICPIAITAELGRAPAVVKVTLQVNGRTEFSGSRPAKTTDRDKDEMWHN